MGPQLDLYILVDREPVHFDRFLKTYCGHEKSAILDDDIFLRQKRASEPSIDLSNIRALAFDKYVNDGFVIYLGPTVKRPSIKCAIINFTIDQKMVLGLSIDAYSDDMEEQPNELAKQTEAAKLKTLFSTEQVLCVWETPPPDSEKEFRKMLTSQNTL